MDITDVGVEGGVPYFVMEFLQGEDVASLLDRGPLEAAVAADIVVPIVSGLCAVHRLGIVHRDIKPENIFLSRDNHAEVVPKLVDFGVSKDLGASLGSGMPPLHTVTGTPHYMSPEQARGSAALDARTDQYALGVLLYQCLSGVRPYEAESLLELMHLIDLGEFSPLRMRVPSVSPELEAVVHRAMARHPKDRFESTDAFGRALLPFASERTRFTHERDFSGQTGIVSLLSQKDADLHARLSANTMPVEAFARSRGDIPTQTSSGVHVRNDIVHAEHAGDASIVTLTEPERRAPGRRLLWLAVGGVLSVAVLLLAWFVFAPAAPSSAPAPVHAVEAGKPAREQNTLLNPVPPSPATSQTKSPVAEQPAVPAQPSKVAPESATDSSLEDPVAGPKSGQRRKPRTPKSSASSVAPKEAPVTVPSDIQLSR